MPNRTWINKLINFQRKTALKEESPLAETYQERFSKYKAAIAPYLDEPPQLEYITDEMVRLCLQSLEERGFISASESSNFECYLNMKGGWTPTLAYDPDYVINFRKVKAAHVLIKTMSDMWDEHYIKIIKYEAMSRIIKTYSKANNNA